jgi:hypothetical protein
MLSRITGVPTHLPCRRAARRCVATTGKHCSARASNGVRKACGDTGPGHQEAYEHPPECFALTSTSVGFEVTLDVGAQPFPGFQEIPVRPCRPPGGPNASRKQAAAACAPCRRWRMTNTHPDQSPTGSSPRWGALVVDLVLMALLTVVVAVLTVVSAVGALSALFDAGFWYVAGLLCGIVAMLTSTVMFAAELLGRWGWKEVVIEQVRGLCVVLTMVAALSALAILESGAIGHVLDGDDPWNWFGLVAWPAGILVIAQGVRRIIRARRRTPG